MNLWYCHQHDANADIDNDRWVDPVCRDITCRYCQDRPTKPSQVDWSKEPIDNQGEDNMVAVMFYDRSFAHPCSIDTAIELIREGKAEPTAIIMKEVTDHGSD